MEKQKVYLEIKTDDEMPPMDEFVYCTYKGVKDVVTNDSARGLPKGTSAWLKEQELYVFTKEELEAMQAKHYIQGQKHSPHENFIRPLNYIESLNLK